MLAALVLLLAPAGAQAAGLSRHVDPMIGTFAPGFVVPGASTPFGMVQNSPDTRGEFAYSGYIYHDPTIAAFSLIHLSGPGVKKAGDVGFMPVVGEARPPTAFDHAREKAGAGAYGVTLADGIRVELAAARRAALQRYAFPAGATDARVIFDADNNAGAPRESSLTFTGPDEVSGYRRDRYPVYWVAKFDRPYTSKGADWVGFGAAGTVTVRVGVSFVDEAGARRNLDADAPDFDIAAMRARAARAWDRELARVRVAGGGTAAKRSFYTALYHSYLHPNVFEDADGRYRGADDQVHEAPGRTHYANFSSWDTYKGQNQLLALTQPKRYRDMLRSLLATARESGKLPRWGEQSIDASHMSGDPAVPMIADGYCRGLVDPATATALYEEGVALRSRRPPELDALGYLPGKPGTTLEYGVADFALALMADGLGREEEAGRWAKASLNYRNILDANGWIHPRNADGSWHEPFLTNDMTGFQEGNSWQYSWLAPHDARGLFDRMGGDAEVQRRFTQFFALHPEAQTKGTFFGVVYYLPQYAPGNEHDLQAPWMPVFAGQPWKAAEVLADVRTLFRPTIDGLPGNDDLGGLSAWHVFSAMGFGPVTPGAPFHVIGSPQFERVTVALGNKKRLVVTAPGASPVNRYVTGARVGGEAIDRAWLFERELRKAGTLDLDVGPLPDRAWATEDRPPSLSDAPLAGFGCRPSG